MLINATQKRLVIGRFSILPGEKIPTVALSGAEEEAVKAFRAKGMLVEKSSMRQPEIQAPMKKPEQKQKEPAKQPPVHDKAKDSQPEAPKEEKPKAD